MQALLGHGLHPLAGEIRRAALAAGLSEHDAENACRLGRPFAERTSGQSDFNEELRRRYGAANIAAGRSPFTQVDPDVLGGLVVRVGNMVLDASARRRLDQIRKQVTKAA